MHELSYCIELSVDPDVAAIETMSYTHPSPLQDAAYACRPPASVYSAAVYFSVMTITSIGYGDIAATPQNASEQVVATAIMLIGGLAWCLITANFCAYITNMSPSVLAFRLSMNSLNSYAQHNALPDKMRQQLRDFFHRTKHLVQSREESGFLAKLSPALQSEVVLHVNQQWITRVFWLRDENPNFLTEVVSSLLPEVFSPGEVALRPVALHIMHTGSAIYGGIILSRGNVWGEDVLVHANHLRSRTLARALTYVESFYITRDMIYDVAAHHTDTYQRLRRSARVMALQRWLCIALTPHTCPADLVPIPSAPRPLGLSGM